jgi:monofunctional biosynthetic peptidoglycan transglycosylase
LKKFFKRLFQLSIILLGLLALYTFYSLVFPLGLCGLARTNPKTTAFIEQKKDEWVEKGSKRKIYQIWVPLSRISRNMQKAVLVAEDPNFYRHHGLDFDAIKLAFEHNWKEKELDVGASTITQQLMKNLYLSSSRNPLRKYREAILTLRVERCVEKDRILEVYLNVIEWGETTYGVEAAARRYFGKSAASLSTSESALLAAMIPNPKIYNPLRRNPGLYKRQQRILRRMSRTKL